MNDQELKNLFKSMKYETPTQIEVARWKKIVRQELLNKTPNEWARLAVACLVGILIGATAFKNKNEQTESENLSNDATIERVYVNLQ